MDNNLSFFIIPRERGRVEKKNNSLLHIKRFAEDKH